MMVTRHLMRTACRLGLVSRCGVTRRKHPSLINDHDARRGTEKDARDLPRHAPHPISCPATLQVYVSWQEALNAMRQLGTVLGLGAGAGAQSVTREVETLLRRAGHDLESLRAQSLQLQDDYKVTVGLSRPSHGLSDAVDVDRECWCRGQK